MDNLYTRTPEGRRDRLFSECRSRRQAQSVITSLFKGRGYSEIITPEVEYYDLFVKSGNPIPQESLMKIIDRSGKILVMRPDCTTPIARVAATRLANSPLPQRLYYNETIFRSDALHEGRESEIQQCGIELIGAPGLRGDFEVIAMAIDTLEASGLGDFHIELGHSGFFRSLAAGLGAGDDDLAKIHRFIELKNYAGLGDLLDRYGDSDLVRALKRVPLLFGEVDVLDEARELAAGRSEALYALDYLAEIYTELTASGRGHRLRFDLGLINGLDYYTGVVFRGYAHGAGQHVLAGGRYDNLVGVFGKNLAGAGFAVYVDTLAACLPPAVLPKCETVIHYERGRLGTAVELLDTLEKGTAELSPYNSEDESMELAAAKGARRLIVITEQGTREVEA